MKEFSALIVLSLFYIIAYCQNQTNERDKMDFIDARFQMFIPRGFTVLQKVTGREKSFAMITIMPK